MLVVNGLYGAGEGCGLCSTRFNEMVVPVGVTNVVVVAKNSEHVA